MFLGSLLNHEIKKKYGKRCQEEGGKTCEYCGVKFQLNMLSCLDLSIVLITYSAGFQILLLSKFLLQELFTKSEIIPMYAKYAVV